MSSSDLPKLWTEPTKIRHIFRKQSFQKISFIKIDLPVGWFLMPKNDFESTNAESDCVFQIIGFDLH